MYKLIVILCFSLSTLGNFTGFWSGNGRYTTHKSAGECKEVFFDLKVEDTKLSILEGGYNCEFFSGEYPVSEFEIVDKELIYESEKVGFISKNKIFIGYLDGTYTLSLILENGKISYKESWDDGESLLLIESSLSK